MSIDSSAIIHESAKIHKDAIIAPYAMVGANVEIGAGTVVDSHVKILCYASTGYGLDHSVRVIIGNQTNHVPSLNYASPIINEIYLTKNVKL